MGIAVEDKRYIVGFSYSGASICFPADLDTSDFIELQVIGSPWAKFIDKKTGEAHDCEKYHNEMFAYGIKIVDQTIERLSQWYK